MLRRILSHRPRRRLRLLAGISVLALAAGLISIAVPGAKADTIGNPLCLIGQFCGTVNSFTATEGVAGSTVSGVIATFEDSDGSTASEGFLASIDWGDGSTPTLGTVTNDPITTGLIDVSASHTYADPPSFLSPPYGITVTVTEAGDDVCGFVLCSESAPITDGLGSTQIGLATVNDGALTPGPVASISASDADPGSTVLSDVVTTFTDANPAATPADYLGSVCYNDGSLACDGLTFSLSSGVWQAKPSVPHTWADDGTFTPTIQIWDEDNCFIICGGPPQISTTANVTVGDSDLNTAPAALSGTEGTALPASTVVGSFGDPGSSVSEFTATINWGDGSPAVPGTMVVNLLDNPPVLVEGGHTYKEAGVYTVTTTVTDSAGELLSATGIAKTITSTATIGDATLYSWGAPALAPMTEGASGSRLVYQFNDANLTASGSDLTALVNWGDGHTSAGTVTPDITADVNNPGFNVFDVSGTHTYADETGAPNAVSVLISDAEGASLLLSGNTVAVNDANVGAKSGNSIPFNHKQTQTRQLTTITDSNPMATAADFTTGGGVVTVVWGDGKCSTTGGATGYCPVPDNNKVSVSGTGPFTVSGSHMYASKGSQTMAIYVSDDGGKTTTASEAAKVS